MHLKQEDAVLARCAVNGGFITREQLLECVNIKSELYSIGKAADLGAIMLAKMFVTKGQMEKIKKQQRRILGPERVMVCHRCEKRFKIWRYKKQDHAMNCPACSEPLIPLESKADEIRPADDLGAPDGFADDASVSAENDKMDRIDAEDDKGAAAPEQTTGIGTDAGISGESVTGVLQERPDRDDGDDASEPSAGKTRSVSEIHERSAGEASDQMLEDMSQPVDSPEEGWEDELEAFAQTLGMVDDESEKWDDDQTTITGSDDIDDNELQWDDDFTTDIESDDAGDDDIGDDEKPADDERATVFHNIDMSDDPQLEDERKTVAQPIEMPDEPQWEDERKTVAQPIEMPDDSQWEDERKTVAQPIEMREGAEDNDDYRTDDLLEELDNISDDLDFDDDLLDNHEKDTALSDEDFEDNDWHDDDYEPTVAISDVTFTLQEAESLWKDSLTEGMAQGVTIKGQSEPTKDTLSKINIRPVTVLAKDEAPDHTRDFELQQLLGQGGMGLVYTAHQASMDRQIAVKLIKPGQSKNRAAQTKFIIEAVVTGDLDHPNIVPVHDLGKTQDGNLFYTMKQVQGTSWDKVIRSKSEIENLEILLRVCDAVAFAHDKGIIHRDLKPENIMLGEYGEVMVMDWGIAISTDDRGKAEKPTHKTSGAGTPAYMSPEVAQCKPNKLGIWSDIYLLGGILYEIVTGKVPHRGENLLSCIFQAMNNVIQPTEEKGELVDIALKAMAAEPEDRYKNVKAFQEAIIDYRSHSDSIAISELARKDLSRAKKTGDYDDYSQALFGFREALKLWPANKTAEKYISDVSLAYAKSAFEKGDLDLASSMLSQDIKTHSELAVKVEKAKKERESRKRRIRLLTYGSAVLALAIIAILSVAFVWINSEKERAVLAEKKARTAQIKEAEQRRKAEQENYFNTIALVDRKVNDLLFDQAETLLLKTPAYLRGWEWGRLVKLCHLDMMTLEGHSAAIESVDFSNDGKLVVTGSRDNTVKIWNIQTGTEVRTIQDESIQLNSVRFAIEGNFIIIEGKENLSSVWNIQTGKKTGTQTKGSSSLDSISESTDGRYVAKGNLDGTVTIMDAADGREINILRGHSASVRAVKFSPDGKRIVTGSLDKTAKIWDVFTGEDIRTLRGHSAGIRSVAFSPDGTKVVTGSLDTTAKIWNALADSGTVVMGPHDGHLWTTDISPDGKRVAAAGRGSTISIWNMDSGMSAMSLNGHEGTVYSLQFSPSGNKLVTGSWDKTVGIWDTETGRRLASFAGHENSVMGVAFSPNGETVLSGSWDGTARIWDVKTGKQIVKLNGHAAPVLCVAFSPDGTFAATGSKDQTVRLWNSKTGEAVRVFKGHQHSVYSVRFSPDGGRLLTGCWDKTAGIWDVASGRRLLSLKGHNNAVNAVACSPDGLRIATAGWDHTVIIWDTKTGRELRTLKGHDGPVVDVDFSPTGLDIVTAGRDKTARIWRAVDWKHYRTTAH